MDSLHIVSVFEKYILRESNEQAILINGKWGSGKTYFWKNTLSKIVKTHKKTPIHISLSGVDSILQLEKLITRKILRPTIEEISNKQNSLKCGLVKLLGKAGIGLANKKLGFNLIELLSENAIELHNYSNDVICFDDLERCNLPIKEIMGYIGDFVENRNSKIIILANEDNIGFGSQNNEEIKPAYKKLKEKVVANSFNFEPNLQEVSHEAFLKLEEKISNEKPFILSLFQNHKVKNLRTFFNYISILREIIPTIKSDEYNNQIKSVICFCFYILNEQKNGKISAERIDELSELKDIGHIEMLNVFQSDDTSSKDGLSKTYGQEFYDKYLKSFYSHFYFYPSLARYILTGYFDAKSFLNELEVRRQNETSPEYSALYKLTQSTRHFSQFSEEEFVATTNDILKYAEEGKYTLYQYYAIASWLTFFSALELLPKTSDDIKNICFKGIDIAKISSEYQESGSRDWNDFGRHSKSEVLDEIRKYILKAHNEKKASKFVSNTEKLIEYLKDESTKPETLKAFLADEMHRPFIQYINISDFVGALLVASNEKLNLIYNLFEERYKHPEFLKENIPLEQAHISLIAKEIGDILKNDDKFSSQKIKKLNLNEILKSLQKFIEYKHSL